MCSSFLQLSLPSVVMLMVSGVRTDVAWVLDLESLEWTQPAGGASPRDGGAVVVANDKVMLIGKINLQTPVLYLSFKRVRARS